MSLSIGSSDASAAITTFGSPLSVPATLNTTQNLNYEGIYTPVPPNPEAPNGLFHTNHNGADTAIWNVQLASGMATAPAAGQALKIKLEGCAEPAPGGPAPLNHIHFQDISPLPGGGAKVNLTSQEYEMPICGENGASGSTVTTYEPVNLCVSQGDYVDFNDEGGYVPFIYRSGVPYRVLGATPGSIADSFIKPNGTNNGDSMPASERSNAEGFAENKNEELMLQVEEGTGPNARYVCPGGTKEAPPAQSTGKKEPSKKEPSTPVSVGKQTDGANHLRIVQVAIYCRLSSACSGIASLTKGKHTVYGSSHFSIPAKKTSHVSIRVTKKVIALLRKQRGGIPVTLSVVISGKRVSQAIRLKL